MGVETPNRWEVKPNEAKSWYEVTRSILRFYGKYTGDNKDVARMVRELQECNKDITTLKAGISLKLPESWQKDLRELSHQYDRERRVIFNNGRREQAELKQEVQQSGGPSPEQLEAEKHPQFLEEGGMLFIKMTPYMTIYGVVTRVIPRSPYRDRLKTLSIGKAQKGDWGDFNNINKPSDVKDGWWLYLPSDKEKEKISDTTLIQYAKRASAKVDHKVPWQILAAIVRTETEGTNLNFRQEFHQPIDDVRFLGNDQESIRVYKTMLAKYGNLLGCSYGPAHVMYRTAFELGFRGTPMELAKPEVSLEYAAKRLLKYCGDSLHNPVAVARAYNGDPHYAKKFISNLQKFQSFPV